MLLDEEFSYNIGWYVENLWIYHQQATKIREECNPWFIARCTSGALKKDHQKHTTSVFCERWEKQEPTNMLAWYLSLTRHLSISRTFLSSNILWKCNYDKWNMNFETPFWNLIKVRFHMTRKDFVHAQYNYINVFNFSKRCVCWTMCLALIIASILLVEP